MVNLSKQRPVPVRFLIDRLIKKGSSTYSPWRLYVLPEFVLDVLELPYEELEPSPMRIGTRIAKLAQVADFSLGGGCCGCTELEKLLNAATPEWVRKHMQEIIEQVRCNAKKKTGVPFPRKMIEFAIRTAIVLERRALRRNARRMTGKEK